MDNIELYNMVDPIFDYQVKNHCEERTSSSESSVPQFRLILIGDSTVGKSSLLRYFSDGKFAEVPALHFTALYFTAQHCTVTRIRCLTRLSVWISLRG
jgi:GTPase SAR1 family protein